MSVTYSAPATVTETSITADLGALGQISVDFHPSSPPTTKTVECRGRKLAVVAGTYDGTIAFHGEEEYTEAEATTVPADIRPLLAVTCHLVMGGSGSLNPRGAELYVLNPGLGPRLSVIKAGPASAAYFFVEASGYSAGISIHRFASLAMPASSFRFSRDLQTATVRPPPPFSGTARYDRRKKPSQRWSGDLTVDMPGMSDTPLTGPFLRAGLVHSQLAAGSRE